ncbi:hypothetical protein ACWKSP_07265 [Micromonosporaceae bacterium Da 78-11]
MLFVEYDGLVPHTLMAQIMLAGGVLVEKLALLKPGAAAAWEQLRDSGEVPMPIVESPVADPLAELAHALRITDMTLPRQDDEDFVDLRALAWSRCWICLPEWPAQQPLGDADHDTAAWGSAKQIAAELTARGVDLSDPETVDGAVRALNAGRLARRLTGERNEDLRRHGLNVGLQNVVVVALPDGAVEGGRDRGGVVSWALDVQGLAIAAERDRAGWRPFPEMPGDQVEVGVRLESQTTGVLDAAEHQLLDEIQSDRQWRLALGVEVVGDERVQVAGGHRPRPEGVLQPQAVGVHQVPADRDPMAAFLTGDNHVGQTAVKFGPVEIDIKPFRMPGHRQPTAPPRTHPAADQLVRVGGGLLCGHGPHQRRHPRGGNPDRAGDLLGSTSLGPQRAHPLDQLVIRAHLPDPSPAAPLGHPLLPVAAYAPCRGRRPTADGAFVFLRDHGVISEGYATTRWPVSVMTSLGMRYRAGRPVKAAGAWPAV